MTRAPVSKAVRRRHGVGGGAPVNFGRRRRGVVCQKRLILQKNFVLSQGWHDLNQTI